MLLVKDLLLPHKVSISLNLKSGGIHVLAGENGSGKSLLLKSLAYLVPATFSTFEYKSESILSLTPELYRRKVMYVPSIPFTTHEGVTEDFLSLPFRFKVYQEYRSQFETQTYLRRWHLEGKTLNQLSSGEKQLVAILRILSLNPEVLLLDEVTSHLSAERALEVEELIGNWMRQPQRMILWVTHQPLRHLESKTILFTDVLAAAPDPSAESTDS
jgi:putative ABC transport system ATP-binding protein